MDEPDSYSYMVAPLLTSPRAHSNDVAHFYVYLHDEVQSISPKVITSLVNVVVATACSLM